MNRFARSLALSALLGPLLTGSLSVAQAQTLPNSSATGNNPNNSPIQRANPNSRQGSESSMPPVRGPSTAPTPAKPTVQNRGIGNGAPARPQPVTPPATHTSGDRKAP